MYDSVYNFQSDRVVQPKSSYLDRAIQILDPIFFNLFSYSYSFKELKIAEIMYEHKNEKIVIICNNSWFSCDVFQKIAKFFNMNPQYIIRDLELKHSIDYFMESRTKNKEKYFIFPYEITHQEADESMFFINLLVKNKLKEMYLDEKLSEEIINNYKKNKNNLSL